MNKERLEKFIDETLNAPNFSNGYDRDSWEKDKQELIRDLEMLEILKKHLCINSWGEITYDPKHHYQYINDEECKLFKPNEEDAKIKEWLENDK